MRRRAVAVRHAVFAVAALIGVAACSGSDGASSTAPEAASSTDVRVTAGVPRSLSFSAQILGGGQMDGASLAGRAVMLWFWAPT
jgi:hypothetical protein